MNCTDINREFECNCLLIKALTQFLSAAERKNVNEWLARLSKVGEELPEAKIRNEYTGYLLINVQNGRLLTPFNLMPPCRKLRPLCRILPEHIYEDALKQFKMNFCFTNGMECVDEMEFSSEPLAANPAEFQKEQPRPRKGIIAFGSTFSNYEEPEKNA